MSAQVSDARRWAAGAGIDQVVAAVGGPGGGHRPGVDGRHGDEPVGVVRVLDADAPRRGVGVQGPADHVAAGGQAEVGRLQGPQVVGGPFDRPALHHPGGVEHGLAGGPGPAGPERAPGLPLGQLAQGQHLGHLGRTGFQGDLAPAEPGDEGVRPVGAEHRIDLAELGHDPGPGGPTPVWRSGRPGSPGPGSAGRRR